MTDKNSDYVLYLQDILKQRDINFQSEESFNMKKNKEIEELKQEKKNDYPFKINLQQPLNTALVKRYSRQMLLKEIAYEGQKSIVSSKIAIVGAGGIGCPLALYLSAAGVGTIGLFDSDTVDVTNLHRQIGHKTSTIGLSKTNSLKNTILSINPHIKINQHPFVTVENTHLLDQYDLVIDGSDNPTCRYIVNDYCMKSNRKLLSGACIGWQAQVTCYGGSQACYRCLWGNDQVSMGGCSTLGVIGMLPGIVGLILAVQALKLIINKQSSLQGKLLTYDGRKCQFRKIKLRKKHVDCLACGQLKLNMNDYDYAKYNKCISNPVPQCPQTTWQQFVAQHHQIGNKLLDVRPSNHYQIIHLQNSINIPYEKLNKLSKIEILKNLQLQQDNEKPIHISCTRGIMSKHATKYLNDIGMKAISIQGGILKYKSLYDERIPQL